MVSAPPERGPRGAAARARSGLHRALSGALRRAHELGLLALVHASEGLDLHLLQRLGGLGDLALALLDEAQHARHARALDLDEDVRARDGLERLDQLEAVRAARQPLDEADAGGHHVLDGLVQLPAPLAQQQHVRAERAQVLALEAELDERDADARRRVRVLLVAARLLQQQHRLDGRGQVAGLRGAAGREGGGGERASEGGGKA